MALLPVFFLQSQVQLEGDIGIFGSIGARQLKRDLVESQLFDAFACDPLNVGLALAQVLERQAVHVVAGGRRVQDVRLEHGVVSNAPNNNPVVLIATDGAVGEDIGFELGVLADFQFVRIFQQRLQCQQHGVAIQLLRHAHVGMGQRNVGRFAGRDGKRQAHQLCMLSIGAIGFGDEGDQRCLIELVQPGLEALLVEDGFVLRFGGARQFLGDLDNFLTRALRVALVLFEPAF